MSRAVDQIGASVVVESAGAFHLFAASAGAKIAVALKHTMNVAVVAMACIGIMSATIFEHLNHSMSHGNAVNFADTIFDYIVDPQSPSLRLLDPSADVTDILHEFDSYQSATKGRRTRNLLHAAYKCLDYGLTDEQLERVINYVNSRFLIPKSQDEIQRRVINFIKAQRKHI